MPAQTPAAQLGAEQASATEPASTTTASGSTLLSTLLVAWPRGSCTPAISPASHAVIFRGGQASAVQA
jgi:hypothetical protein